jgi:hypothetical protein
VTLITNPEWIRNARAQLRTDRMLITATICAILSLAVGFAMAGREGQGTAWALEFLRLVVRVQVAVLLIVGGLASVHAIQREKDTNTFDFQRVTRLTPLELTLGKLFGAPLLAYFIVLCLMPAALVGALVGGARPSLVLVAYAIVILGAIGFHALALLISLLVDRDAAATVVLLLLLILGGVPAHGGRVFLDLNPLGPSFADTVLSLPDSTPQPPPGVSPFFTVTMTDRFLGWPVPHVVVLTILYATLTMWFVLAVARNIKRDPAMYEVYAPAQALGLALYLNLILVGFFRWGTFPPLAAQEAMLALNAGIFFALGLALLLNRDRARRLSQPGADGAGWITAMWPAPYVTAGMLAVGLAVVAILLAIGTQSGEWDIGLAIFRVVFVAAWFARDILYLQWMNLHRRRRPLLLGLLYLIVFYTCVGIVLTTLGLIQTHPALASLLAPGVLFVSDTRLWADERLVWFASLLACLAEAGVFTYLNHRRLIELSLRPGVEAAA